MGKGFYIIIIVYFIFTTITAKFYVFLFSFLRRVVTRNVLLCQRWTYAEIRKKVDDKTNTQKQYIILLLLLLAITNRHKYFYRLYVPRFFFPFFFLQFLLLYIISYTLCIKFSLGVSLSSLRFYIWCWDRLLYATAALSIVGEIKWRDKDRR